MTEEERNKEIEWLMGCVKRSAAGGSNLTFMSLFVSVLFIAFVFFAMFFFDGENDFMTATLMLLMGGAFLLSGLFSYVSHKRIAHAETPQELLGIHDRMWIIQSAIFMVIVVVLSFLEEGNLWSKTCLILSGVLLVIAAWLANQQRLRLWVGIGLLIAESVLLYFSGVGLIVGLSLLLGMLSIIKGEKSLFTNKESEGLDEGDEQDIKRLRELVKESESRIEMNTNINK